MGIRARELDWEMHIYTIECRFRVKQVLLRTVKSETYCFVDTMVKDQSHVALEVQHQAHKTHIQSETVDIPYIRNRVAYTLPIQFPVL